MKLIGCILMMIAYATNVFGQTKDNIFSVVEQIQGRIAMRDSTLMNVKRAVLSDSLSAQITDYKLLLTEIMKERDAEINECMDENSRLCSKLAYFRTLISSDTLVFHSNLSTFNDIPLCLKPHVDILKNIIELRLKIETVEQKITGLLALIEINVNETIRNNIGTDVDEIYSLIEKIKQTGLTTLSEEQKLYFKPGLTERYNQFSKYFDE